MEIIKKEEIRKIVKIVVIVTSISIIMPVCFYIYKFYDYKLSDIPSDWGTFGDYVGGTIGTLFGAIAALFTLISIYITLKIAIGLQEYEHKKYTENILLEKQKFEKEIELIHKQNIPLPFLNLKRGIEDTSITICNHGNGPLLIKKWYLKYKDKKYDNFHSLFPEELKSKLDLKNMDLIHNSSPEFIIPAGKQQPLFSLQSKTGGMTAFIEYQIESRIIFKETSIHFEYEDIFGKKGRMDKVLYFLRD